MSIEQRILDHIESKKDEITSFMQKLIQTRSVTGDEAEIGALMEKECTRDGLDLDVIEPLPNRVSVVAKYSGTGGGPRVMMYSHYDVVPAGDPDSWRHPPFGGEIHGGSTLMTSAPMSARSMVQKGPARCWVRSTILMPCRADVNGSP